MSSTHTTKVVVIAGQTGAGKSALAEKLAEHFPFECVSADSVQVYRGFDIGSAKPTESAQRKLPHHLIDLLNPDEAIDAASYARRADHAILDIETRGKVPIVVGGTGLWIRALLMGLVNLPAVNQTLRTELEEQAKRLGAGAMHMRLAKVDPLSAERIHKNDTLRVVRALEVHTQTGEALGQLRQEHARGAPRYQKLMFVLEHGSEELRPKLLARTHKMLHFGWVDEVRALLKRWPRDARAFRSVGYREVCTHLDGELSESELPVAIERETWRYAKRQRNWFRAEKHVDLRGTFEEIEGAAYGQIEAFLS